MKDFDERDYEERSIVSEYLNDEKYGKIKYQCRIMAGVYTVVLAAAFLLSLFLYSGVVRSLLEYMLGWNFMFFSYVVLLIIAIDKTARFPKHQDRRHELETSVAEKTYRLNKIKIYALIAAAVIVASAGELYSDRYILRSRMVYVEEGSDVFHILNPCCGMDDGENLKMMRGGDAVDNDHKLCPVCGDLWNKYTGQPENY